MSKRTVFTTVTPLPPNITREVVVDFLHDHEEMIDLNPLVKERHPIPPPPHASPDELNCQWFSLTDKISYLPGGLVTGDVTYTCAFHDLPDGVQTHCYAPAGLTIRDKWSVGGSLPGEVPQPGELGLNLPPIGLYIREDVNMKCNVFMAGFVKKTLKKSHAALVDRLKIKAEIASNKPGSQVRNSSNADQIRLSQIRTPSFSQHMSTSAPNSRPSSASSSVHSAQSSPSCYSAQTSPLWSRTPSNLTSPPQSVKSPAVTSNSLQPTINPYNPPSQPMVHIQFTGPTPTAPYPETPFFQRPPQSWPSQPQSQPHPLRNEHPSAQTVDRTLIPDPLRVPQHNTPDVNKKEIPQDALWQALGGKHQRSCSDGSLGSVNGQQPRSRAGSNVSQSRYPEMNPYEELLPSQMAQKEKRESQSSATLRGPFVPEVL
ncbi:hypothetical protein QBC40DRAFT_207569 [Triangularia verruculosa]|uniref:DUF7053 domain-containing protein n=1 Tax=Triangularia verruculosa TaxID=2587418 RepID=A0AAN7AS92_9PEZI|nr:hypothetical protein QBC40DRAFT_207569 [Triangularia verruculosa]